jgi:hypothetical protein
MTEISVYEDNTSYFTLPNRYLNCSLANLKQVFEKMDDLNVY